MRERVTLYGGELHAGHRPGGRLRRAGVAPARAMIGVLIADDQALVRAGFRMVLEVEDDITVVGEAGDGEQAVHGAQRLQPDVVLMDIRMPDLDGIAATRRITAPDGGASARVLIVTTFDLDEYVYDALGAGASGFLLKDSSPDQLVGAIRVVAGGEALLAPSVTSRLIGQFAAHPGAGAAARPRRADRARARGLQAAGARDVERRDRRRRSSSATARSRPTSRTCSPSSACATASTPSCSPTSPASSAPAVPDRSPLRPRAARARRGPRPRARRGACSAAPAPRAPRAGSSAARPTG